MSSVNKVILIGNLGKDPELRALANGNQVAQMTIATSERVGKDENKKEVTEWHRVNVWGKTAENCAKYLSKGRKVYIEGRIQTRSWEKDGKKNYSTEIVANKVVFLSPHEKDGATQATPESWDDF